MFVRVTMHKMGMSDYLLTGKKEASNYGRNEKDNVLPLYGNLEHFKKAEIYTNKYKNWKKNYEHISISFSKKDMKKLENLSKDEYIKTLKGIVKDYIKHRCSGYDIENEIIAYAELHEPKIKYENGKERLLHIHIGISYLNPLSDTKVRTTFYNNSFISETVNNYIAKKYEMEIPIIKEAREERMGAKDNKSEWSKLRYKFIEDCKNIKTESELIDYLNTCGYKWEKRPKHKPNKITIIPSGMKAINLRGKDFPTIDNILNNKHNSNDFIEQIRKKDVGDLEKTLVQYYKERSELIDKRRSKKTKGNLEEIYRDRDRDRETQKKQTKAFIYLTYQQKIFNANYGHMIENQLKGYFVGKSEYYEDAFIISNKKKNINIVDKGAEIMSTGKSLDTQEEVKIMLEIALAKGWELDEIDIEGDDEFIEESYRQIRLILEKKASAVEKEEKEKIIENRTARPTTSITQLAKEEYEKQETQRSEQDISITELKLLLKADFVLDFAVKKYKLDSNDYEITSDNKINNKNNRKKPKSIIDFLKEELHIDTKVAISICFDLYNQQKVEFIDDVQKAKAVTEDKESEVIQEKNREEESEVTSEVIQEQPSTSVKVNNKKQEKATSPKLS